MKMFGNNLSLFLHTLWSPKEMFHGSKGEKPVSSWRMFLYCCGIVVIRVMTLFMMRYLYEREFFDVPLIRYKHFSCYRCVPYK